MNNFIKREAKPLNINCLENWPPGILKSSRIQTTKKGKTENTPPSCSRETPENVVCSLTVVLLSRLQTTGGGKQAPLPPRKKSGKCSL